MKTFRSLLFVVLGVIVLAAWIPLYATAAAAATFVVNTTEDSDDGACTVRHCTLREAMNAANGDSRRDTIHFNIPGAGPHTIAVGSVLPDITRPVIIDGYSQPGASPSTVSAGTNAVLQIVLNGSALTSGWTGLVITGGNTTIRGLVIQGFFTPGAPFSAGIAIYTLGGNIIEGNFIGTNARGTQAVQNGHGIHIQSSHNTIGGASPAARNVISGNGGDGIWFFAFGFREGNVAQGNYIGTDATGLRALGNGFEGIASGAVTRARFADNLIADNADGGISIFQVASNHIEIYGNKIGTDRRGGILSNGGDGIEIGDGAHHITIGGATRRLANRIAFNGGAGVVVRRGKGVAMQGNMIYANDGLGIDLGNDGVTPNDPGDLDTGANQLQNYPGLTEAESATQHITGKLNSTPGRSFTIELFKGTCDRSGFGGGKRLIGTTVVTTNSAGRATFDVIADRTFKSGNHITATATDADGNTSEFSKCKTAS